jgi:glycosyltransferase involved in cell wall biosynthesis
VSVVIPVRNGAATIGGQLAALAGQDPGVGWEVVVVDNGSTDDTRVVVSAWLDRVPCLRLVEGSARPSVSATRNAGVQAARGERILMCDADDVVGPAWVDALADALEGSAIAAGPLERARLNGRRPAQWAHAGALSAGPRTAHGYLPFAPTNNLGFQRSLFDAIGGFDPALTRAEDMDFCWRAIRHGAVLAFAPGALVHVRLRSGRRASARQGFADGRAAPVLYRRHRSFGMRREPRHDVGGDYRSLLGQLGSLAARDGRAERFAYDAGQRVGRLVGSVRERVLFL